jgi:hypothetical protein
MTMEVSRKILDMFVDGELSSREMENLAALLEEHPDWDAYVRKQETLRAMLRGRYCWTDNRPSWRNCRESGVLKYGTGSRIA